MGKVKVYTKSFAPNCSFYLIMERKIVLQLKMCILSSLQATTHRNSKLHVAKTRQIWHTPLKAAKTAPSGKLNWLSSKIGMTFFTPYSYRELCPQTYSFSLPLNWSKNSIPASTNKAGPINKAKSPFYSIFARKWHPSSGMAVILAFSDLEIIL